MVAAHCITNWEMTRSGLKLDLVRLGENDLLSNPDCVGVSKRFSHERFKKKILSIVLNLMFFFSLPQNECVAPAVDYPIAERIVHEEYNPGTRANDIALIRLQRPATLNNSTQLVCLPSRDSQNGNYDGTQMTVAGFGRTEYGK